MIGNGSCRDPFPMAATKRCPSHRKKRSDFPPVTIRPTAPPSSNILRSRARTLVRTVRAPQRTYAHRHWRAFGHVRQHPRRRIGTTKLRTRARTAALARQRALVNGRALTSSTYTRLHTRHIRAHARPRAHAHRRARRPKHAPAVTACTRYARARPRARPAARPRSPGSDSLLPRPATTVNGAAPRPVVASSAA